MEKRTVLIRGGREEKTINVNEPIDKTLYELAGRDGFLEDGVYVDVMEAYGYTEHTEDKLMELLLASKEYSFSRQDRGWYIQQKEG